MLYLLHSFDVLSFEFVHNFFRFSHILLTVHNGLVNVDIVEGNGRLWVLVSSESTHGIVGTLIVITHVIEALAVESLIVIAHVVVETLIIHLAV